MPSSLRITTYFNILGLTQPTEAGRKLTPAEVSDHYMSKSLGYIKECPVDWAMLLGKKTLMSLNAVEMVDTEDQYVYEAWSPLMRVLSLVFHFGLLAPFAIIGIWRVRKQWRSLGILFAMAALFQATMIAFFVFGRYRFPIVPLMIVFASPLIADLLLGLRDRWNLQHDSEDDKQPASWRFRKFAAGLLCDARKHWQLVTVAVIMLTICHLPIISTENARAVTYNNYGGQMLLRGRFDEARDYFERSLKLYPDNPLAHNNLGVAYREQQQEQLAIEHFTIALSLEPTLRTARRNLARLQKS